jgi:hypothetical protein
LAIVTSLETFLSKENTTTKNVLYNIAVVNARLSIALAKALNLQKNVVEDISEKISQISSLNVKINAFKPNSVKTPPDSGPFGKNREESLQLLESMQSFGVEGLDDWIAIAKTKIPSVKDSDIQLWSQKLNAISESLSSKSQQETLRIQTFTSRYTQATDQSTTVLQKDSQSKNSIISNYR